MMICRPAQGHSTMHSQRLVEVDVEVEVEVGIVR